MLTFIEFINERKVDPVALAQRAARRFGKKSSYGKWLRAEPGEHVPLKGYRSKEADSVFNKSDRVRQKIGGKHTWDGRNPEEQKKAMDRYRAAHTRKTVEIKSLRPTQPFVRTGDVEKLKSKVGQTNPTHVVVATHKGNHYILDGHHSVAAAAARGEKEVSVKHINLDDYK